MAGNERMNRRDQIKIYVVLELPKTKHLII